MLVVKRIRVAEEVPRGIDERVHGVGLSASRFAAAGTVHVQERLGRRQRVALTEHHVPREFHREVLFGNRDRTAIVAVNDGNGRPPVPLSGDEPRPNLPVDGLRTATDLLEGIADGLLGFRAVQAIETLQWAVHHPTKVNFGAVNRCVRVAAFLHHQNALDGNAVLLGKVVVSLVMGGHGHDGPGTVGSDDKVPDPNGDMFTRQGVDGVASGKHALFLVHVLDPIKLCHHRHLIVQGFPGRLMLASSDQRFRKRMFGSEGDER